MGYTFDWHEAKDQNNQHKHGVSFREAQEAFYDPYRIIAKDDAHSTAQEKRYFCFGLVEGRVVTVRFTLRAHVIWIIGAGHWRKGRKLYETQEN